MHRTWQNLSGNWTNTKITNHKVLVSKNLQMRAKSLVMVWKFVMYMNSLDVIYGTNIILKAPWHIFEFIAIYVFYLKGHFRQYLGRSVQLISRLNLCNITSVFLVRSIQYYLYQIFRNIYKIKLKFPRSNLKWKCCIVM